MNSELTRKQLIEIIETDHVQCGEASYLARMALAAMDSEPVAMKEHQIRELVNQLRDVAIKYHSAGQLREQIARTVRAHMLQAGAAVRDLSAPVDPQVSEYERNVMQGGNSPAIPDGYVLAPREPTDEMIAAAMNCDDVEFNSDETFCVNFDNIYKAMIEAAQEVTSARVHPARDE